MPMRVPPFKDTNVPNSEITYNDLIKRAVHGTDTVRLFHGGVGDCRNITVTLLDLDHALQVNKIRV